MRRLPTILLVLSFPAGILAYTLALRVMQAMPLPSDTGDLLILFVPLFVAGLVMLPFLIPFFDRKARQDLAEYRRSQAPGAQGSPEPPGAEPSSAESPGGERS